MPESNSSPESGLLWLQISHKRVHAVDLGKPELVGEQLLANKADFAENQIFVRRKFLIPNSRA
jgi:hypothetical protein